MKVIQMVAIVALTSCLASAKAAPVKAGTLAFQSGNWSVYRSTDEMTDKTTCTGIYKGDASYQLTENSLFLAVSGGADYITLRYDDTPPDSMRRASKMERDINAFDLEGSEFGRLSTATRLRARISTLVKGIVEVDLDLAGIGDAIQSVRTGCPGQVSGASSKAQASACTPALLLRMKAQHLSPDQIAAICTP